MFKKGHTINQNGIMVNMSCLSSALHNKRYPEHNNATISHILFPHWEKSGKQLEHMMPYITYEDGYVMDWKTNAQLYCNSYSQVVAKISDEVFDLFEK